MDFKIVPGKRKNNLVVYENGTFFKTKFIQRLCAYKWKCNKKRCNAKIYIDENLTKILEYDVKHTNHEKQSSNELNKKLFSNQLKRKHGKCKGCTSKIVNQEILNDPQIREIVTSDDIYNIKQCIYRERKKHILSLPKNCDEITADPIKNLEVKCVEDDTSCDGITMSSDNDRSVSSIEGNVKSKMDHLDSEVQRKLINNLDDILSKQARPAGQDEYVRPSVIVWNPAAMRRQTTFAQNLQDTGAATGTYFRPV